MKIIATKVLNTSVDPIWKILRNPGNMPAWNPKCCSCSGTNDVAIGSFFNATFKLSEKVKKSSCEIIELMPNEKITIRYSGEAFYKKNGFVDETFYLISHAPQQTEIKLEVDFTNSGLPFLVKFLMWFNNAFGYKNGRSSLEGIEDLLKN